MIQIGVQLFATQENAFKHPMVGQISLHSNPMSRNSWIQINREIEGGRTRKEERKKERNGEMEKWRNRKITKKKTRGGRRRKPESISRGNLFVFPSFAWAAVVVWWQQRQWRRRRWPPSGSGVMATAVAVCCVVCWDTTSHRLTQLSTASNVLKLFFLCLSGHRNELSVFIKQTVVHFWLFLIPSRFVCWNNSSSLIFSLSLSLCARHRLKWVFPPPLPRWILSPQLNYYRMFRQGNMR